MTQQAGLTPDARAAQVDTLQNRAVVAWLRPGRSGGAHPGVMLDRDAVIIRAPFGVFDQPLADFDVVIETADGAVMAVAVSEVRLVQDRLSAHKGMAVAMLRLATPLNVDVRTTVDRGQYWTQM